MGRLTQVGAKIGLLDHVGGGNLGDDATLDAVRRNIIQRWPNAEIVAFSMNPRDTETQHGIKCHPIRRKGWSIGYTSAEAENSLKERARGFARKYRPVFYLLRATHAIVRLPGDIIRELLFLVSSRRTLMSFDLLIISGGGQLTEKDGPWAFLYTIFKWVVLARSAGVKCMFLNVGAGPLTLPLSRFFVTRALGVADYVSFRDDKSRALVRTIGFTGESWVCPDNVYSLDGAAENGNSLPNRAQQVGIAPMPYPGLREHLSEKGRAVYDEYIRRLASFSSWLLGQSYELTFFGTDIGVDPSAIEDLRAALLTHCGIGSSCYSVSHSVKTTDDLLATMSGLDYVVTSRFHGVVFAHLLNKPVLAISPHSKVKVLMGDLELHSYCVDIDSFDLKLLTERFAAMVANAEEIKTRMAVTLAGNRKRLRSQFDELFPNAAYRGARATGESFPRPGVGAGRSSQSTRDLTT